MLALVPITVRFPATGFQNRGRQMTVDQLKWLAVALLFAAGLVGGLLPWRLRETRHVEFWFSLGNAFAGGVFLAVGLIHMLGDAAGDFAERWPDASYPYAFLLAGCTFMGLLLLERVLMSHEFDEVTLAPPSAGGNGGRLAAYVLLLTLSIHSILAGLALGLQDSLADVGVIFIALMAHKGVAAFALGVSLLRSQATFRSGLILIALFSVTTPLGVAGGACFTAFFSGPWREAGEAIFNAMAAGTFLYIAALDIFSEEFLRPRNRNIKFVASTLGFAAMALVAIWT